ncbi:hypothetical protein AB0H58_21640 [Nocardia neocaledoniensis]|uniref:hypothetical protein n=1 Tax=Nocardia neocaledoniensis TaxID=236511 RepID=UPI0033FF6FFA
MTALVHEVLDQLRPGDKLTAETIAMKLSTPVKQVKDARATLRRSGSAFFDGDAWHVAPALQRDKDVD